MNTVLVIAHPCFLPSGNAMPQPSTPPRTKVRKPQIKQGKDDSSLFSPRTFFVIVVLGIGLIAWLISASPKQKRLVCDPAPNPSLLEFGRCKEE